MKENNIFGQLELKKDCKESFLALINSGVEGVCLYETSGDDKTHEENLHLLKELCSLTSLPLYAKVNPGQKEDVKKYLYAGCTGVIIDETCGELIRESIKRFGSEDKKSLPEKTDTDFKSFKTNDEGLIPCIVQDYKDGTVLMLAYMNEESFNETLKTGRMTYFSRSRNKLWVKGEESGHFQYVKSLTADCDMDTLLAKVEQVGVACHTGERSCFFNSILGENDYTKGSDNNAFNEVYEIILDRKNNPKEGSYTNYLFDKGVDKILKKIGEECTEVIIAAKNPKKEEIIYEISDLIYHLSVLMAEYGVDWNMISKELKNR